MQAAFAAIDEVDKTHFVRKVKLIPTEEGRNAELALYRRKPEEAEAILLQVCREDWRSVRSRFVVARAAAVPVPAEPFQLLPLRRIQSLSSQVLRSSTIHLVEYPIANACPISCGSP